MNRSHSTRTHALPLLAAAAATGLALAGCGASTGSSSGSAASGGSASQPAASSGASPAGSSAGTVTAPALFPAAAGDTWVYQEKLTATKGTVTNQVAAVSPQPSGGDKVTMKSREDLSDLPHTTTTSTYVIHPDGSISVPLTQVGSTDITVKSGSIVWPSAAQLASGQPQTSTLVVSISEAGKSTTVGAHIVARGAGTQTVHVPAGTYQATVVNETMTVKVMGLRVGVDIRTWLASGVGPVKSEVSTKAASLSSGIVSEQVLKSFTKG
jgi:uncharacterized protein DUF3108